MATYFIGDVHGCHDELQLLLDKINYDSNKDRLLFTGDLVGRGAKPLATLKLAKSLLEQNSANQIVLGNHDLHLIALYCGGYELNKNPDPTLIQVLEDDDAGQLINWLIHLPLIYNDPEDKCTLVHAGIPHIWTLAQALENAAIIQQEIRYTYISSFGEDETANSINFVVTAPFLGNDLGKLLASLYGNSPTNLQDAQNETDLIRTMLNYFTRMRLSNPAGAMALSYNGPAATTPTDLRDAGYAPWFSHDRGNNFTDAHKPIVFGHWAALGGVTNRDDIWALDYGCAWGKQLAAKRLEDAKLFLVECLPRS